MSLAAGKLNKRVTVQQQVTSIDTEGLSDTNWSDVASVWAAIEPLSVRELLTAQQVQSNVSVRCGACRRNDPLPRMNEFSCCFSSYNLV